MTIATNGVGAGARLAARRIEMEVDDVNVRGALFAAGFGLLLLGGCGDDDHEAADKTADASADDLSAREEQSIVDSAVLTLSDLPSGWSDNAAADTSEDALEKRQQREIAACIGVEYERLYGHGTSAEAAFVSPDGGELSSSVGLEESGDDAKFVIDTLASEAAASCLIDQLQSITEDQGGGTGVEARDVSLQRLSFPEVGDQSNAYRISLVLTGDREVNAYLDVVVARVGRGGVTMQGFSLFNPFDLTDLEQFTRIVVDRLRTGLTENSG